MEGKKPVPWVVARKSKTFKSSATSPDKCSKNPELISTQILMSLLLNIPGLYLFSVNKTAPNPKVWSFTFSQILVPNIEELLPQNKIYPFNCNSISHYFPRNQTTKTVKLSQPNLKKKNLSTTSIFSSFYRTPNSYQIAIPGSSSQLINLIK